MSLLLDALKKAADDKKKHEQSNAGDESTAGSAFSTSDSAENNDDEDIALTLDSIESEEVDSVEDVENEIDQNTTSTEKNNKTDKIDVTSYTVSDEALSMLIDKTNRDVKKSRRVIIFSIFLVSAVILISGGIYYYMDMQTEIAALERKHKIAIHSMELKTNKEKIPASSKIIRNLVSEADLNEKVEYAKKHMAEKKAVSKQLAKKKQEKYISAASNGVSFQKTNKVDPVAEALEQAWQAYENAQYPQAKIFYRKVLVAEKNNRDAWLGLGAIAVIEKDKVAAKAAYTILLNDDPRDPIAIAALASLRNNTAATETDEKYLLRMLQKNPGDTHLSFALGNVYAQQNKWKLAQQSYFNAWQGDNQNADYTFNLAVSMDQLGKSKQAINFYQDSLRKSENKQVFFSRQAVKKRITELSEL